MNYEDIIQKEMINFNQDNKYFDKKEYTKQKKELKKDLFELANKEIERISKSGEEFIRYLDTQSKHDNFTVTNIALLLVQYPNAVKLYSHEMVKEKGWYIKTGEKSFKLLKPYKEYQKEDGTVGIMYNPTSFFDASQLSNVLYSEPSKPSIDELISALTYKTPVAIALVDKSEKFSPVSYEPKTKTMLVQRDIDSSVLLEELTRAYFIAEYDLKNYELSAFEVNSALYMFCKKYGIETPDTSFLTDINKEYRALPIETVRESLENIKGYYDNINSRVQHGLYVQQKKQKAKQNHQAR